jgi:hypothetical protein
MLRNIIMRWKNLKQKLILAIQYVGDLLSVVGDKFNSFFICECCVILKEQLDYERKEREFFTRLFLKRTGDLRDSVESEPLPSEELEEFTQVKRGRTVSGIRKMAEDKLRERQAVLMATPATPHDLSEAEKLFQFSLTGAKN